MEGTVEEIGREFRIEKLESRNEKTSRREVESYILDSIFNILGFLCCHLKAARTEHHTLAVDCARL